MDIARTMLRLDTEVRATAPIDGMAVGSFADKTTWRIAFKPGATATQRAAAQAVIDGFDTSSDPDAERAAIFVVDTSRADLLTRLKTASPAQIRTWVGNNVTTLAEAKALLANILVLIALDARS